MTAVRLPAVLVASAVTLILVGRSGGPLATAEGAFRTAGRAVFVPVEAAGEAAFRPLRTAVAGMGLAGEVAGAEAARARAEERLRSEAARAETLEAENRRLEALLGLDGPSAGDGVAARVVSTAAGRSGGALLLDRGSGRGIRPGMAVVAAGGLVGRVVEVGTEHSTVLPLADRGSAVGVRAGAVAASGVAEGRGAPTLRLELLDRSAPVEAGSLVVTSGLRHSRFPAGLPVGHLTGSKGRWTVEPFAAPDRLELVKVLLWEPQP